MNKEVALAHSRTLDLYFITHLFRLMLSLEPGDLGLERVGVLHRLVVQLLQLAELAPQLLKGHEQTYMTSTLHKQSILKAEVKHILWTSYVASYWSSLGAHGALDVLLEEVLQNDARLSHRPDAVEPKLRGRIININARSRNLQIAYDIGPK